MATSAAIEPTERPVIQSFDDLITPEDFAIERPDLFPLKTIKWQLHSRHRNGLAESGAVLKVGRRILLSRSRFLAWVSSKTA